MSTHIIYFLLETRKHVNFQASQTSLDKLSLTLYLSEDKIIKFDNSTNLLYLISRLITNNHKTTIKQIRGLNCNLRPEEKATHKLDPQGPPPQTGWYPPSETD